MASVVTTDNQESPVSQWSSRFTTAAGLPRLACPERAKGASESLSLTLELDNAQAMVSAGGGAQTEVTRRGRLAKQHSASVSLTSRRCTHERRRRISRARDAAQFTLRDTQRGAVFVADDGPIDTCGR